MEERRRYKRLDIEGTAILSPEDGTSRTIKGTLVSISFVGITTVDVEEKINPDIPIKLELITKLWDEPIIGEGKIIHVEEIKKDDSKVFRIGIELVDVEKKAIQGIINLIQSNIASEIRKRQSLS